MEGAFAAFFLTVYWPLRRGGRKMRKRWKKDEKKRDRFIISDEPVLFALASDSYLVHPIIFFSLSSTHPLTPPLPPTQSVCPRGYT